MGGLKAPIKWVFMGYFVVGLPCEKVLRPILILDNKLFCRKKYWGPWIKIEIWSKKERSKARQFVVQLPNPIVDFSRLEPLYFAVNLLCFWLKLKWRKNIY